MKPDTIACAGGVDVSVAIPWLREHGAAETITRTVDPGGARPEGCSVRRVLVRLVG